MSRWIVYFKERFPLHVYLLLAGGIAYSGVSLPGGSVGSPAFLFAFLGLMVFFALLRLMDEYKDYAKDVIAHPERPLPRGLLSMPEVRRIITATALLMLAYGVALAAFFSSLAGAFFIFVTSYLWFMFREFFVGPWLEKRQLFYALSHQFVLIPLCAFTLVIVDPSFYRMPATYDYGLLVLGSFFSYEVSRKLDPNAHMVLKTYRSLYGVRGAFALVLAASAVATYAALRLGVFYLTIPFSVLLLVSFGCLANRRHKLVEAVAALSLLVHAWAVALFAVAEYLR